MNYTYTNIANPEPAKERRQSIRSNMKIYFKFKNRQN